MADEIQNAIDISNLSEGQILEMYNDVLEGGVGEFLIGTYYGIQCNCYCYVYRVYSYGVDCPGTYSIWWSGYYCTKM